MIYLVSFIALMVFLFFSNKTLWAHNVHSKEKRFTQKEEKTPEVSNIEIKPMIGKVRLEWEISEDNVSHIELFGRYRKDSHFWKIEGYPKSVRAVEVDLLPLAPIDIKIHLVFNDGKWSDGALVKTSALHKNVVPDEVEGRQIHVYLPDGYEDDDVLYPVIYMHDGQNLFCEKLAFVEDWQIDSALERLVSQNKMDKAVVVGIFNSSKRAEEYTPFADKGYGGGKAREFSAFVVDKIIPYVEKKYRVSPKKEDRAVMGSSFGGILSLWMGYTYPEVFSVVGAISPSLWIADGAMLEELHKQPKKDIKIWIDQGTAEFSTFTRNTVQILLDKGYEYGKELVYYEVKDAPHNELAWAERIECPFIMFKGKSSGKCTNMRLDIQNVRQFSVGPEEVVVNPIGYFDNGMWYSLYSLPEYSVIADENKELLKQEDSIVIKNKKPFVGETGVVEFFNNKKAKIRVKYLNLEETITVFNPNPIIKPKSKKKLKKEIKEKSLILDTLDLPNKKEKKEK